MRLSIKNIRHSNAIWVADIISGLLIILFLYTSLSKLANYYGFRAVLIVSPLLKPFAGIMAWLLPVVELLIVLLLFFPATRAKGLKASLALLAVFTLYLSYMVTFTPDLPCSCGGVLQALSWRQHIIFNSCFILLAITGIMLYNRNSTKQSDKPP